MNVISLFALCLVVITHIYSGESKAMWILNVGIEGILFLYGYLNMFSILSSFIYPELLFDQLNISKIELGLFVTNDIIQAVTNGQVFFYLLPSFLRILIAVSRLLYFSVTSFPAIRITPRLNKGTNPSRRKPRLRTT